MLTNQSVRFAERGRPSETGKKVKNFIYQYADLIGKGNFAKVYKGMNLNTQDIIAVKLVSLDELKSKHLEALVFEEIRILQLMNHPNILRFHEALLSERNCYIVTELCNQGSLDDRIKSKSGLTEQQLGGIILDLYNGMKYLREKGVTHRDIKPANIFISHGQMKIADFGLAKFYKERFHDLDIGSPQYMSPEGLILNTYSEKTDIWSLGITIYELLHGTTPFVECQSEQELIFNTTRPIPEHKWRRDINPLLRQLINRMLEIDQFKRPSIYQLANQPYIRMLIERDISQTIKLTESISLCSLTKDFQDQRVKMNTGHHQINHRPASFTNGLDYNGRKNQNQRLYSTTSSENSTHSPHNTHFQNPLNVSVRYVSPNTHQLNGHHRFSFAKMHHNPNLNISVQKQQIPMNSSIQTRPMNQIPERISYSEGRQAQQLCRMPSQQVVPIQGQLLFVPNQRQKSSSAFESTLAEHEKKQYSPTLFVRPNNMFY